MSLEPFFVRWPSKSMGISGRQVLVAEPDDARELGDGIRLCCDVGAEKRWTRSCCATGAVKCELDEGRCGQAQQGSPAGAGNECGDVSGGQSWYHNSKAATAGVMQD